MHTNRCIAVILITMAVCGLSAGAWAAESSVAAAGDDAFKSPIKQLIAGKIGRLLVLRSELNITEDQREKIGTILKKRKADLVPIGRNLSAKRRALRDAVLAEPAKEATIRAAAQDLSKAIEEAALMASKVIGEARPVLTPKQRESISNFMTGNDKASDDWLSRISK